MTKEIVQFEEAFSAKQRRRLARKGKALPDGSFPVSNSNDLGKAVKLAGNARNPKRARAFIKKRAAALGLTAQVPTGKKWK